MIINDKYVKFWNGLDSLVQSRWFAVVVALYCIVVWATKCEAEGLILLSILIPLFVARKNGLLASLVILPMIITSVSLTDIPFDYAVYNGRFNIGNVLGVVSASMVGISLLGSLIYHFVKYKPTRQCKSHNMLVPTVLVVVPVMLGGAFDNHYVLWQNLYVLAFVLLAMVFVLLFDYAKINDATQYISHLVLVVTTVICIEMTIYYLRAEDIIQAFNHKSINLGWGFSNVIAPMISVGFFMSMYNFVKQGKLVYFIISIIFALFVLVTFSRGCLIMFCATMPITAVVSVILSKKKLKTLLAFGTVLLLLVMLVVVFNQQISEALQYYVNSGFDESGRDTIRFYHIQQLQDSWLFGNGFIEVATEVNGNEYGHTLQAHSFLITILSGMGIFGGVFFGIYYYKKYLPVLLTKTTFNAFAIIACVVFVGYAYFDNTFFYPYQNILILLVLQVSRRQYDNNVNLRYKPRWLDGLLSNIYVLLVGLVLSVVLTIGAVYYANYTLNNAVLLGSTMFDYALYAVMFTLSAIIAVPCGEGVLRKLCPKLFVRQVATFSIC